jgi:hypothetical protein
MSLVIGRSLPLVAALALSGCTAEAVVSSDDTAAPADEANAVPTAEIAPMDERTYAVRLADLEARVAELKAQIRASHTHICSLSFDMPSAEPSVTEARAEPLPDLE